ncbi:hypothetical protein EJ04DRAFT_515868 [Polyplosphaeria fusca]|uniref:Uncharacterized protein n=1 Tax=Polyplosphaeria fusca TaxID=682080 RepID=A0A9P4QLE6_9PLEO|nr:hypothetical protein EJ04DRAFT_515868 [Polyplosphaeria fusca]
MIGNHNGTSDAVQLQPTIIFRCGSKKCKEVISKRVHDLKYLQKFSKGRIQFVLGAPIFAGGSGQPDTEPPEFPPEEDNSYPKAIKLPPEHASETLEISIYVPLYQSIKVSFCGLPVYNKHKDRMEVGILGGIVRVGNRIYGLTTAHFLFHDDLTTQAVWDRIDNQASTADRPTISCLSFAGHSKRGRGVPTQGNKVSDFALINMGVKMTTDSCNTYGIPRSSNYLDLEDTSVPRIIREIDRACSHPTSGNVWIILGPLYVLSGWLLKGVSSFVRGAAAFRTMKIQVDRPLRKFSQHLQNYFASMLILYCSHGRVRRLGRSRFDPVGYCNSCVSECTVRAYASYRGRLRKHTGLVNRRWH